jgi:predicted transcriptional regulator
MNALWERQRGTASEMQKELEEEYGWAYSTIKTMLDRLVDKGFVKSRRIGNVYDYVNLPSLESSTTYSTACCKDRWLRSSIA